MLTRWVERLFDDRYALLRLTLLAASGVGYLLLRHDADQPYLPLDWLAAGIALALCPVVARWPLLGLLALSATFGVAESFGSAAPTVPQVGATWAVFEVAVRRPTRQLAAGGAVLAAAHLCDFLGRLPGALPTWLFDISVTVGAPVLIGMNIRAGRLLAQQAERRAADEAHRARAAERTAIARELHDLVAHHVASMVLRVGVARHVLRDADPRVGEVFDDLHASGTTALADLRRLVAVLRNPETARGGQAYVPIEPGALPAALAAAVDRAAKTGLRVDATIDPAVAELDAVRGLAVLRLTQEGLTNVAKHAGRAARARLSVKMADGAVHWEIIDDGGGVRVPEAEPGHGLTGMRERVEVLGGRLSAGPAGPAETGWRLRTVLPAVASR